MTILVYAVVALLAVGFASIGLAWADLESPAANQWAGVASACVLLCLGIGAAMSARDREAGA